MIMVQANRVFILMIKVNKMFPFFVAVFLIKIENMFSVSLSSYRNACLGELEKAVKTLTYSSCSHS